MISALPSLGRNVNNATVEAKEALVALNMVEGVGPEVVKQGLMSADAWNRGIVALYRTAEPDGVFCYTFFKATARK